MDAMKKMARMKALREVKDLMDEGEISKFRKPEEESIGVLEEAESPEISEPELEVEKLSPEDLEKLKSLMASMGD